MSSPIYADPEAAGHVVIFSGGLDSYTLLQAVLATCRDRTEVLALSFSYRQRHARELDAARRAAYHAGLPTSNHLLLSLNALATLTERSESSLTNPGVATPHGHYAEDNMRKTVVPGRNTVFLAHALALAQASWPGQRAAIYYGAHAGDHTIYPDCRPEYITAMANALYIASEDKVRLRAPWRDMSKGEIIKAGLALRLPAETGLRYDLTWTCYEGGAHPCGQCGACVERAEAFAFAGIPDPLLANPGQTALFAS